jgi:phosphatidylglycerol---prolipoprotein diacylglyceryl transferase
MISSMCQVLFTIPFVNWPVPGYGVMLLCAFVSCLWLAKRLGRRAGIEPVIFSDLAYWLFITGILGARLTFVIVTWHEFQRWSGLDLLYHIFAVWDGGLVFYGSAFGGILGYYLVDRYYQPRFPFDRWKMIDVLAPCIALGLCLGRIGCLLNGCCYGNLACPTCPAITFPLSAAARAPMVDRGVQTAAGFTVERDHNRVVDWVEPGSGASLEGLRKGDEIVGVNGQSVETADGSALLFHEAFRGAWPRGKNDLSLTVERNGRKIDIAPFTHRTVPLHPTQLYESISMILLVFFLVSIYPYNRVDGLMMVLFMVGYAVHRFLNESLRNDTDPVAFGMTLSQNISIVVLIGAAILGFFVWRHHISKPSAPVEPITPSPSTAIHVGTPA